MKEVPLDDLFSGVDPDTPGDERDDDGPIQPDEIPDDEQEACFAGSERAGTPSMSNSGERVRTRWRAYLEACDPSRRELLERIEEDSYRAARRRKLARLAMEATLLPEVS